MKHLSLETARALKTGGYPQDGSAFYLVEHRGGLVCWHRSIWSGLQTGESDQLTKILAACPTTDELLQALTGCGCELYEQLDAPRWFAIAKRYVAEDKGPVIVNEETPIEALAALWLAIWAKREAPNG